MAEYIECRHCESPNCKGCNVYSLAIMLYTGKFDCLMNGNRTVNRFADVALVVRCKDCAVPHNKWTGCPNLNGLVTYPDFYCALGERKAKEGGEG